MTIQAAVNGARPTQPILPVTHITRYGSFESTFLESNQVPLNSICPRNGKEATYLFYGSPFYRLPHKEDHPWTYEDVAAFPIGLLIPSSQMSGLAAEVYPFDTGAFSGGLYESVLERARWRLDDFVVSTKEAPSEAAKLVNIFFGSNQAYLFGAGAPVAPGAVPAIDAVKALHKARMRADIRRRGIEIVALESMPLAVAGLVVIGPERMLGRQRKVVPTLDRLLSHPDTTVITYQDFGLYESDADSRVVLEYASKWLKQQGFLPDTP